MKNVKQIALAILLLGFFSVQAKAETEGVDLSSGWVAQRNSVFEVKTNSLLLQSNAYILENITGKLSPGVLYRLEANVQGTGKVYLGLAFYDANQKLLKVSKAPINGERFGYNFAIPSYAVNYIVFAKSESVSGIVKLSNVSLKPAENVHLVSTGAIR